MGTILDGAFVDFIFSSKNFLLLITVQSMNPSMDRAPLVCGAALPGPVWSTADIMLHHCSLLCSSLLAPPSSCTNGPSSYCCPYTENELEFHNNSFTHSSSTISHLYHHAMHAHCVFCVVPKTWHIICFQGRFCSRLP